jgi:2-(1,2-epoxy-1,2-dihydrophenyl)acetyl-CoA isomerase
MRTELADALDDLEGNPDVAVIVITGAGRGFCAGADVNYMQDLIRKGDRESMTALVEAGRRVVTTIRSSGKPVIGSINGVAAGGGANLALACDIRIASAEARLSQSFNRIGLHPDWGGTFFLPRLVGEARALELFWLAETLDAFECEKLGLFNKVVPGANLASETFAFARLLAAKPQLPIALAKKAVYASLERPLSEMLDFELKAQLACFDSADAEEGVRAFAEKRAPVFGGQPASPQSKTSGD